MTFQIASAPFSPGPGSPRCCKATRRSTYSTQPLSSTVKVAV